MCIFSVWQSLPRAVSLYLSLFTIHFPAHLHLHALRCCSSDYSQMEHVKELRDKREEKKHPSCPELLRMKGSTLNRCCQDTGYANTCCSCYFKALNNFLFLLLKLLRRRLINVLRWCQNCIIVPVSLHLDVQGEREARTTELKG